MPSTRRRRSKIGEIGVSSMTTTTTEDEDEVSSWTTESSTSTTAEETRRTRRSQAVEENAASTRGRRKSLRLARGSIPSESTGESSPARKRGKRGTDASESADEEANPADSLDASRESIGLTAVLSSRTPARSPYHAYSTRRSEKVRKEAVREWFLQSPTPVRSRAVSKRMKDVVPALEQEGDPNTSRHVAIDDHVEIFPFRDEQLSSIPRRIRSDDEVSADAGSDTETGSEFDREENSFAKRLDAYLRTASAKKSGTMARLGDDESFGSPSGMRGLSYEEDVEEASSAHNAVRIWDSSSRTSPPLRIIQLDLIDEVVVIKNISDSFGIPYRVPLDGFAVEDSTTHEYRQNHNPVNSPVTPRHHFRFEFSVRAPGLTLEPGKTISIYSGRNSSRKRDFDGIEHVHWHNIEVWRNEGDTAFLLDPVGNVVHQLTRGPVLLEIVDLNTQLQSFAVRNCGSYAIALDSYAVLGENVYQRISENSTLSSDDPEIFSFAQFLPSHVLSPESEISIFCGPASSSARSYDGISSFHWTDEIMWNDDGDTAYIVDLADLRVIHRLARSPNALLEISMLDLIDEVVCVRNCGSVPVDLDDYVIEDEQTHSGITSRGRFVFSERLPHHVLQPGKTVSIYSGHGATSKRLYDNVEHVFWFSHAVWNNNGDCAYLVEKNSGKVIHSHQVAGRSAHLLNSPVLPLSPPRSIHRDSLIARSPFVRRMTRSRSQGLNIQVDDDGETIESEWRDMDENGFDDMRVDSESYHSSTSAPSEVEYDLDPTDIIVPPHPKAASMMSASMQVVVGDAPRDEYDDDLDIDAMEDSDVSTSSVPSLDGNQLSFNGEYTLNSHATMSNSQRDNICTISNHSPKNNNPCLVQRNSTLEPSVISERNLSSSSSPNFRFILTTNNVSPSPTRAPAASSSDNVHRNANVYLSAPNTHPILVLFERIVASSIGVPLRILLAPFQLLTVAVVSFLLYAGNLICQMVHACYVLGMSIWIIFDLYFCVGRGFEILVSLGFSTLLFTFFNRLTLLLIGSEPSCLIVWSFSIFCFILTFAITYSLRTSSSFFRSLKAAFAVSALLLISAFATSAIIVHLCMIVPVAIVFGFSLIGTALMTVLAYIRQNKQSNVPKWIISTVAVLLLYLLLFSLMKLSSDRRQGVEKNSSSEEKEDVPALESDILQGITNRVRNTFGLVQDSFMSLATFLSSLFRSRIDTHPQSSNGSGMSGGADLEASEKRIVENLRSLLMNDIEKRFSAWQTRYQSSPKQESLVLSDMENNLANLMSDVKKLRADVESRLPLLEETHSIARTLKLVTQKESDIHAFLSALLHSLDETKTASNADKSVHMVESRAVLQELAESIRNSLHSIRSSLENRLSSSNSDTQKLINSLELSVSSLRNEMESRTTRLQEEFASDLSELRDRIRNTEKSISSRIDSLESLEEKKRGDIQDAVRIVVSKDIEEMRERLDALRVNISSLDTASMTHLSKLDLLSSNDQKKSEKIDKLSSSMNEIQDQSRRAFSMSQTLSEELKTEVGSWKEERTRMAPQVQRVVNLKTTVEDLRKEWAALREEHSRLLHDMTSLEESVDSRIRVALSAESSQKESKSVDSETDSGQSEEVFPDFALYSVGARIVDSTDTFDRRVESSPVFGSLVVVFEGYDNPPVNVLTPDITPGSCWAMRGSTGYITMSVPEPVQPKSFALHHPDYRMSIHRDSAPREFQIQGFKASDPTRGIILGTYSFNPFSKQTVTRFPVQNTKMMNESFDFFMVYVKSNHGNKRFTCLYHVSIYGNPVLPRV